MEEDAALDVEVGGLGNALAEAGAARPTRSGWRRAAIARAAPGRTGARRRAVPMRPPRPPRVRPPTPHIPNPPLILRFCWRHTAGACAPSVRYLRLTPCPGGRPGNWPPCAWRPTT